MEKHGALTNSSIDTVCKQCGQPLMHENHTFDADEMLANHDARDCFRRGIAHEFVKGACRDCGARHPDSPSIKTGDAK